MITLTFNADIDIWQNIFIRSHPRDLIKNETVCKSFYQIISGTNTKGHFSNIVWKAVTIQHFSTISKLLMLWDKKIFYYIPKSTCKTLYKHLSIFNKGDEERSEYQQDGNKHFEYLLRIKEIFKDHLFPPPSLTVSLSFDLLKRSFESKLQWCYKNKNLSFEEQQAYIYLFLKNQVDGCICDARINYSGKQVNRKKAF